MVLSRQSLPVLENSSKDALKGGYIIRKEKKEKADVVIMATGSETGIAVEAANMLEKDGISARVVSMPCLELFEEQPEEYRNAVLPPKMTKRVVVEAGSSMSWGRYAGIDGCYITMDTFGASAPAAQLFEKYGFTAENVREKVKTYVNS